MQFMYILQREILQNLAVREDIRALLTSKKLITLCSILGYDSLHVVKIKLGDLKIIAFMVNIKTECVKTTSYVYVKCMIKNAEIKIAR